VRASSAGQFFLLSFGGAGLAVGAGLGGVACDWRGRPRVQDGFARAAGHVRASDARRGDLRGAGSLYVNPMARQMALVLRHHPMKIIPPLEDLIVTVAVSVKATVTIAVEPHNLDISAAAHSYHVAINDGGDILVGWRWQAGFLDRCSTMTGVAGGVTPDVMIAVSFARSDTIKPPFVSGTAGEGCETCRDHNMHTLKFAGHKSQ
jgi:hypothetical protein